MAQLLSELCLWTSQYHHELHLGCFAAAALAFASSSFLEAHGLIPDATAHLDAHTWGTLAIVSGAETISVERAVVRIKRVLAKWPRSYVLHVDLKPPLCGDASSARLSRHTVTCFHPYAIRALHASRALRSLRSLRSLRVRCLWPTFTPSQ